MASSIMVSTFLSVCLFVVVTSIGHPCSAGESCSPSELAHDNLRKLATANNELALNLHRSLVHGTSENVFFSPLSISTAFGMLFYGARGDTAEELRGALGYNKADLPDELVHATFKYLLSEVLKSGSSDGYVLNSANSVLVDKNLELVPGYKSEVEDLYQAIVQDVDFAKDSTAVVSKVNNWVKEKTNGKIEKLLDELDASTVLVLLNAVYFKGTWRIKFETSKTRLEVFFNGGLESSAKQVSMMHMKARFRYTAAYDCQVLELPYKGDNVSMLILLPDQRDGLAALEDSLTAEKLSIIQEQLYDTKVIISLPKFKVEFSKELSDDFQGMGAQRIFNAGSADFSGMSPSNSIAVSQVLHKAVVEVNEEGSEAAAVTGIVSNRMRPLFDTTPVFKADHPFLFAIVEKGSRSDMILFMGRVNQL